MQTNNNISILDIQLEGYQYIETIVSNNVKTLVYKKELKETFCPLCHHKCNSKGGVKRRLNHQVLIDSYKIELLILIRRWICSNDLCRHQFRDQVAFANKDKRTTNLLPLRVCLALKDPNKTFASVAREYNLSPTSVRSYFINYVNFQRLELSEIICIDEVYLNINPCGKYCFVIQDFITKEVIDIVKDRHSNTLSTYFMSIPIDERLRVKYVICDMYGVYKELIKRYFPASTLVIDSFHVISLLIRSINNYINIAKRKSSKALKELNEIYPKNDDIRKEISLHRKNLHLLNNHSWVLTKNRNTVNFNYQKRYISSLCDYLNTNEIINMFYMIDYNYKYISEAKEC